jgi:hypothetical protein
LLRPHNGFDVEHGTLCTDETLPLGQGVLAQAEMNRSPLMGWEG